MLDIKPCYIWLRKFWIKADLSIPVLYTIDKFKYKCFFVIRKIL